MSLGSSPWGEQCAQVGTEGYGFHAVAECGAYKAQLARHYAAAHGKGLPEGATLNVASKEHDFGTYWEVEVVFADTKEAVEAAYWLEANMPEEWDGEAKMDLRVANWAAIKEHVETGHPYLFCSVAHIEEPAWLKDFRKQAEEHGLQAVVRDGHLYVENKP